MSTAHHIVPQSPLDDNGPPVDLPSLRSARAALLRAISDGATDLRPVLVEVEDALIASLNRSRRVAS